MLTKIFGVLIGMFTVPLPALQTNNINTTNIEIRQEQVSVYNNDTVENQNQETFDEKSYNQEVDLFSPEKTIRKSLFLSDKPNDNNVVINLDEEDPYYSQDIDKISSKLDEKEKQDAELQLASLLSELGI